MKESLFGDISREPMAEKPKVYDKSQIKAAAFSHYRSRSFPYRYVPVYLAMQKINKLSALEAGASLRSQYGYDVADSYHPQRFHAKTLEALRSPFEAFHDDRILDKAFSLYLDHDLDLVDGYWSGLNFAGGTRPPFNFRPGVAQAFYRWSAAKLGRESIDVFDPCMGYGGRLVGAIASQCVSSYIGVDASAQSVAGNRRMAADLAPFRVECHHAAIEDFDASRIAGTRDVVFTSPPYFCKELYSDEPTQSCVRYTTWESWTKQFLWPLMRVCADVAKPGAVIGINVADFKLHNKKQVYGLCGATRLAAHEAGLTYAGQWEHGYERPNWMIKRQTDTGAGDHLRNEDRVSTEPLFIFRKPREARHESSMLTQDEASA